MLCLPLRSCQWGHKLMPPSMSVAAASKQGATFFKAKGQQGLVCSGWRKTGAVNPQCTSFLPHTILYVMTDRGAASS